MKKKLVTLHLSSLGLWDLGRNKGRVATYLPLKTFAKKGHDVIFLSGNSQQKFGDVDGIYVKWVRTPKPLYIRYLSHLTRLFILPITTLLYLIKGLRISQDKKPDIIYAHREDTALPAYILSRVLKTKYVLRLYGVGFITTKSSVLKKILRLDLLIAFLLKADLYILTNDDTSADLLAKSYGVPEEKIHFLKNGVYKNWAGVAMDSELKKKIAPDNEKIILSISRLVKSKQIRLIVEALPELISVRNNFKLVIVGDGIEKEKLKQLSIRKGVSDYVIFVGAVEHSKIVQYIQMADLFVSMNVLTSMNNPVLEAMICKKTVVALNEGNIEELIQHNINGILIEPDNIETLPFVLDELLGNKPKCKRIGERAQQFMMENWPSWEERVNYEVELIENLCNVSKN